MQDSNTEGGAAAPTDENGDALAGVRVLDIATFVAAPFCGTILADFGAEVIKIEQPNSGDSLRQFGTITECGDSLVWLSEARNKRCVTLDLRRPEGAEMFRKLVAQSDVVLENFRPGTLEKWGLGFDALSAIPRMSRTPPKFRHTGRPLGADNEQVYRELLGLSESELQGHRAAGVV